VDDRAGPERHLEGAPRYLWDPMSIRPRSAPQRTDAPAQADGAPVALAAGTGVLAPGNGVLAPGAGPTLKRRRRRTVLYDDQALRPRRRGPAPRMVEVRRVRRVLRRIDTWSVFRFSVVMYLCGLVVFMTTGVGLWLLASGAGAIPSIEHFITQLFALKRFTFKPRQLFFGLLGVGAVGTFVAMLFTVLTAVLFNLISDIVGGIELTILEEEPVDRLRPAPEPSGGPSGLPTH
jgi:hypothetical protein